MQGLGPFLFLRSRATQAARLNGASPPFGRPPIWQPSGRRGLAMWINNLFVRMVATQCLFQYLREIAVLLLFAKMTPQEFTLKWSDAQLKERSGSHEHFIDLCNILDEPTPAKADPKGE